MTQPTILWLARTLPVPLDAGDRIYTARLVESVARAGARVEFHGLRNPEAPSLGAEGLDPIVDWRIVPGAPNATLPALLSREPLVGARFATRTYRDLLTARLREGGVDAIVLDQYGMAWALPIIAQHRAATRSAPLIHVAHDFETDVTAQIARDFQGNPVRRLLLRRNADKAADAEARLARACDMVVTLTEHDAECFRSLNPAIGSIIAPPGYSGPRLAARTVTRAMPRRVALLGSYRWIAKQMNLAAFLEVADHAFEQAGIELIVIGDTPDEFRQRWAGRLRATRFLGFVDDLVDALAECRMGLVVEATGGGFKLKVLDYTFLHLPVAALRNALTGQPEGMTCHFLIEDDAAALVQRIVATIDDVETLNALQRAAGEAAERLFSWDERGVTLLDAFSKRRELLDK